MTESKRYIISILKRIEEQKVFDYKNRCRETSTLVWYILKTRFREIDSKVVGGELLFRVKSNSGNIISCKLDHEWVEVNFTGEDADFIIDLSIGQLKEKLLPYDVDFPDLSFMLEPLEELEIMGYTGEALSKGELESRFGLGLILDDGTQVTFENFIEKYL